MNKTTERRHLAPKWLLERDGITQRQWRTRKRAELKTLSRALHTYNIGSAYCPPADAAVGRIASAVAELRIALSAKEWK